MNKYVFEIDNVRQGYIELVEHVERYGDHVSPRGQSTREISGLTVVHHCPQQCVVSGIGRGGNLKIGAAEALQLVGGFSDPHRMGEIAPNFKQFMDGGALYGAYGPRIRHQMDQAIWRLKLDESSRQAHVAIWRDSDIAVNGVKDLPCTIGFTFHIRDDALNMHTYMRSNDVWWGFAYDVTQFCFFQICVAAALRVDVGTYFHHADSFHLYDRDRDRAYALQLDTEAHDIVLEPFLGGDWEQMRIQAHKAFYNETNYTISRLMHHGSA